MTGYKLVFLRRKYLGLELEVSEGCKTLKKLTGDSLKYEFLKASLFIKYYQFRF